MGRHELSDADYARILPLLPSNDGKVGAPWSDHRPILNGLFWRLATGASWRDIPHQYGPWQTIYDRYRVWLYDGTWDRIHAHLLTRLDAAGAIDWEQWGVDGTSIRAQRAAAGASQKKASSATTNRTITRSAARLADSARRFIS